MDSPLIGNPIVMIVSQVILFLTTVLGFLYKSYQDSRNRRWDLEDRQAARMDMNNKAEIATKTAADDRHEIAEHVTKKIDENTRITAQALEVASQVSQKIEGVKDATKTTHERIEEILKSFDSINGSLKVPVVESVVIKAEKVIVTPGEVTT